MKKTFIWDQKKHENNIFPSLRYGAAKNGGTLGIVAVDKWFQPISYHPRTRLIRRNNILLKIEIAFCKEIRAIERKYLRLLMIFLAFFIGAEIFELF